MSTRARSFCLFGLAAISAGCASTPATVTSDSASAGFRADFLRFCDLAASDLLKPYEPFRPLERGYDSTATHHMPAFEDAHAVRALAAAYDLTGDTRYLDACRHWSDWVLACQKRMIPAGAYYMNHSRAPGEDKGQWNAADSGTVGMGVLATAMRCTDLAERERYLDSVRSFLQLMIDNWVNADGGISNGLWPEYAGSWWCSTATVGKLAFLMHAATGEKRYLDVAMRGMDWLARYDFEELKPITFEQRPSGIIFYCFDFYAAGLRHYEPGAATHKSVLRQFDRAASWLEGNQKTRGAPVPDYTDKNVDMAAMPSLMYAFGRRFPDRFGSLVPRADDELRYARDLLLRDGTPNVSRLPIWEVMTWGMMSQAERLLPGSITEGRAGR